MKHAIETASVGLVLILHTRGVALLSSKGQMEEIWSFDFKRYIRLLPNAELEAALDLSVFHVVAIEIYRSMVEDDDYETAFDDEDEFLPLEKRAKLRILLFPTSQMKYRVVPYLRDNVRYQAVGEHLLTINERCNTACFLARTSRVLSKETSSTAELKKPATSESITNENCSSKRPVLAGWLHVCKLSSKRVTQRSTIGNKDAQIAWKEARGRVSSSMQKMSSSESKDAFAIISEHNSGNRLVEH
ncbi:hypothetical protein DI09_64p30 [Mitosporidium daphniae]|uniref:Uncharacterized protein n=1 Tax=Mitosporidium daphniae TaxID=1485682 RepID=A0A098VNB2_9MICR|nr:uncharacterized protein DI09_64p30 [Mitosporidium daphniae]KGG50567.1 hypothetical protein DI09_64p30 [Mitosporidium daphniae]|eukprot:XP_013237006.1 uncharacterized protein DI09_64p30 [Mitosporidium daphniae]